MSDLNWFGTPEPGDSDFVGPILKLLLETVEKATGIYTVNLKEYGIEGYEVHADGGEMLTIHVDTAAAAKRVAKNVWNNGMTVSDAEHLEEWGE